jgi:hypothetical protein
MTISKTLASMFVAAVATTLICSPAFAFEITFDENGNGCVDNSDHICTTPLTFTTAPDPTGRVAGDVLIYTLPGDVFEGDVGISDFGTGTLSDVLTFTDANGGLSGTGDLMIFYSELGGSDLADSGLPGNEFFIGAQENADGTFTYNAGNIYNGNSPEGVPEPVTLSLFGAGLLGAATARRRKAKVA